MAKQAYHSNIESETLQNTDYRRVLFTGHLQLVLMNLKPGEEIGSEIHQDHDQFFRVEQGKAKAILDGVEQFINEDEVLIVPGGVEHNVINIGDIELKLYTIYAPSEHPENTVQHIKP